jgi:hypothetical protein
MKNKNNAFVLLLLCFCTHASGQKDSSLFERLQAISNQGIDFFNIDGIDITSQSIKVPFSKKNILKKFKRFSIREQDLTVADSLIQGQNFYVLQSTEVSPGTIQKASYYFIENKEKELTVLTFTSVNQTDRAFERTFASLVLNKEIPKSVYTALEIDSINFAGRKIILGKSCNWMGINNVQCPYYGQMNWSVHKTLESATQSATDQYNIILAKKGGKIISETWVDVVFEGTEVKARKVIYDFVGVKSLLAGMGGGKTLTIYFVASPARQHFVSCTMSFWDNDSINPSGLAPLLEQVMKLPGS